MEPAADLFTVAVFQLLPNELEADVLVESAAADDVSELDLEAEVVEHGFGAGVSPQQDQMPPKTEIQQSVGRIPSSSLLPQNLTC